MCTSFPESKGKNPAAFTATFRYVNQSYPMIARALIDGLQNITDEESKIVSSGPGSKHI